jgi:thiol:disulfide interchange protein DsbD
VKLIDKVVEPTPIREYDENFEANLDFFKSTVTFTQKVDKKSNGKVTGTITYMVCNDVMCLPPVDLPFEITIP